MSWPVVKPPWKNVKWQSWPQNTNWTTGPNPQWKDDKEDFVENELNNLKQEIEILDKKGEWEYLKRSSNPYELVFSQTQDPRIPQSISSLKPLSRSFFKMIEILTVMDFFKRHTLRKNSIKSAHVCEGPGGFIEALLHLSSKNAFKVENVWAMTLRPTKTNIPGWKRAYNFLKKSPMVSIEYGADDTGNIMVPINQGAFLEKTRGKCQLFTADGGFDFSEHYGTQEEEVLPLLVSSVLIGLQTLSKGGDFVLKIFDTESKATIELIALMSSCFESWTLYKPGLSRPCNAEKYFLGRGYKIAPGWLFKTLVEIRNAYACGFKHMTSIFTEIPKEISSDINTLVKFFIDEQVAALKYAITSKEEWNLRPEKQWTQIQEHSMHWCKQFQIPVHHTGLGSAIVNKNNPIPWNLIVASHRHSEDAGQPE
jgi:23S rRNA U2552 (ribose-2'-O)-methylase RlmE/FtsJ